MSGPITVAICGCGSRGLEAYAPYQELHPERMRIVAGADVRPERLRMLRERYGVAEDMCFASDQDLLARPRLADVLIVATQDRQHVPTALQALEKGYHVLLEKPISPLLEECVQLREKARETGRVVVVCHVLRYTRFYAALERLLREGAVGKIETIDAVEHVGYWHYAHSFVRGNWRRSDETSPMILAKSCHDMDLFRWLAGARCRKIQSFGSLDYFRAANAPAGAAARCLEAGACREHCPYDAEKIYITGDRCSIRRTRGWPVDVVVSEPTEEKLREALRTGPYGRCVFRCDNDVVDHQTVDMDFEGDIHATFTMTAFTDQCYRTIRVTGTLGDIQGDMRTNQLLVHRFGRPEEVVDLSRRPASGHGGGDTGVMDQLWEAVSGGGEVLTSVDASVESHVMALAAEASRLAGGAVVDLAAFQAGALV